MFEWRGLLWEIFGSDNRFRPREAPRTLKGHETDSSTSSVSEEEVVEAAESVDEKPNPETPIRNRPTGIVMLPKRIVINLVSPPVTPTARRTATPSAPRRRGRPTKRVTSSKRVDTRKQPAARKPLTPTTKTARTKERRHRAYLRKRDADAQKEKILGCSSTYWRVLRSGPSYRSFGGTRAR
ncbi:hypothetical protein LTR78_006349 [Recurvomyces mirabilis]|uniref:Uncharacterized protein n=1 Tax=Recurvomyces mirabilis TaxID=574656 RepID=A0AAE0WLB2_9PEZI|nr:hypothetical protein LTR78_006349 [Recurvomyces mirabilis]KAK5152237.1 hypothetical protein LTS14_008613 [Recurvomyces mirabilis]